MQENSFLDVKVGRYALALPADLVRGVLQEVTPASAPAPVCDLAERFGAAPRQLLPYAVLVEAGTTRVVFGVDQVGHLRGVRGRTVPLPPLGLLAPQLFEGAVRHAGRVLLVLACERAATADNLTLLSGAKYTDTMQESGEPDAAISPVMTLAACGTRLAVRIQQMDGVALASDLAPVPHCRPEHLGLFDRGADLVPVLSLTPRTDAAAEQLVAVLHVRGEPVGLAIDRPGRVHAHYWPEEGRTRPAALAGLDAVHARGGGESFWIVDPDRLWQDEGSRS